jgi:hypothetical protein
MDPVMDRHDLVLDSAGECSTQGCKFTRCTYEIWRVETVWWWTGPKILNFGARMTRTAAGNCPVEDRQTK